MDWATLSKSLIQFSVNGWNCVSSLLLTCGQTVVEVMKMMVKDNGTSFKRSHACTATLSAPNPAAGHCRPTPLPGTPGQPLASLVSLLWGHCSFLLGSGTHKVLSVPFKSLFLQSCKCLHFEPSLSQRVLKPMEPAQVQRYEFSFSGAAC